MQKPSRRWFVLVIFALIPIAAAVASGRMILHHLRADPPMEIDVDLSRRTLSVVKDGEVEETYGIAIGRPSHPTPTGTFYTGRIDWNPAWVPPPGEPWARNETPKAPGEPGNPMQGVKIYFSDLYYIHGTNDPESIGTAASHGCIRMEPGDAKELADMIEKYGSVPMHIHN